MLGDRIAQRIARAQVEGDGHRRQLAQMVDRSGIVPWVIVVTALSGTSVPSVEVT